jgi:uncharacterized membrane protein YsdA (DUF1294 family)/cold shock CspA family protein
MSDPKQGTITTWKDEQGYGFIHPDDGSPDLFIHVSAVQKHQRRPKQGDKVRYEVAMNEKRGQPQAAQVEIEGVALAGILWGSLGVWLLGFIVLTLFCLRVIEVPVLLIVYLALSLLISLITFEIYGLDKRRATAQQQQPRVPESTLHFLELIGGWPGALIAQHYFRHKVRKPDYQFVFWLIVAANVALIVVIL